MQTRKLFYEDCHLRAFDARVTGCERTEKGYLVTLDATAFYPEGGGQACDIGTLGGARVLDVWESGGKILHLCDGELAAGQLVQGQIDYDRRFDLMQQHTGEHIVSGIIHRKFGYHNIGFHMGKEFMEVDFDGPIPAQALAQIEQEANEAVWQNVRVKCWYPSLHKLPGVHYRTKRALPWPVRIVEIPGFDSCACCGVHTAMTGEVGVIKIVSCVKFHQGVRLEMLCGGRAYRYLNAVWEQNRQVSQSFSAKMLETGQASVKINDALAAEKYRAVSLQGKWLDSISERYVNQRNVICFLEGLTPAQIRELADRIAERSRGFAAVFSGSDEEGYSFCIVSGEQEVKALGKALTNSLNGRGGGKPQCQQGSIKAEKAKIETFFTQWDKENGQS